MRKVETMERRKMKIIMKKSLISLWIRTMMMLLRMHIMMKSNNRWRRVVKMEKRIL